MKVNTQPISFAISIGRWCRARHQIDLFMRNAYDGYRPKRFFFDSLQAGGGTGVCNILERDFKLSREDIEVYRKPDNGRYVPRDRRSGFEFLHDFGSPNRSFLNYEDCAEALSNSLTNSLAKYNYLGKKTDSILRSTTNVGLVYEGELAADLLLEIDDVLTKKYKKKIQIFNVLDINDSLPHIDRENIHVLVVDESNSPKNGTFKQWEGNDPSWAEAFSKIYFGDVLIS